MAIDQYLGVSYKLSSSENFDDFMKELGVGIVTRNLANTISPVITLTKNEDLYTLKTESAFKNSSITFKLGEEFTEDTPDGRKVQATITIDGDTMTHVQAGEKTNKIVRKFSADEVVAVMTINNVVCNRTYKRV